MYYRLKSYVVCFLKHWSTGATILLSLKIVICRCTQKWNVSSEQTIASSADRNKNTPVKLNNAHHGNSSACKFFHVCGEFKSFDVSAGLSGCNKHVRGRSSFRSLVFIRVKWIFGKCLSAMFLNIVTYPMLDKSIL